MNGVGRMLTRNRKTPRTWLSSGWRFDYSGWI